MWAVAAQVEVEMGAVKEVVDVKLHKKVKHGQGRSQKPREPRVFSRVSVGSGSLPIGDSDPAGLVNQTRAIRGRTASVVACTSYVSGCLFAVRGDETALAKVRGRWGCRSIAGEPRGLTNVKCWRCPTGLWVGEGLGTGDRVEAVTREHSAFGALCSSRREEVQGTVRRPGSTETILDNSRHCSQQARSRRPNKLICQPGMYVSSNLLTD